MIIVDKALEYRQQQGIPIKAAMVGAGFMGRGIALQILNYANGIDLVAIANRHIEGAQRAFKEAGINDLYVVKTIQELEDNIKKRRYSVTEDAQLLCEAANIDVVLEVTGTVEYGANVVLSAIKSRKHVILMNAELDGTIGPILKVYADKEKVVITNADGDQPGVIMNLYRFVKGIGVTPVLCGNVKGLHDPYRNPTTQESFARKWNQKPHMVTSFADGTKISFEQTIVANATGMKVLKRGMLGLTFPAGTHIREAITQFPEKELLANKGIVDYIVGVEPSPGVFLLGTHDHPAQKHYLNLYKLGEGPLYCFYTPYHLCHFEVPNTIARAVLFNDATIAPSGAQVVDVIATAKRNLKSNEIFDGIGCYMTYGQCENSAVVRKERLLPMGLAEGCRLKYDVPKDHVLTYDDVELPKGRLSDKLKSEQDEYFSSAYE